MPPGFDYPEPATMFWTALAVRAQARARTPSATSLRCSKKASRSRWRPTKPTSIGAALRPPQSAGYGVRHRRRRRRRRPPRRSVDSCATTSGPGEPAALRDPATSRTCIVDPIRPQMRVLAAAVVRRAADRVRQRRQPAARARHGAPARDRCAAGHRRGSWTHRAADAHRERRALGIGRGSRRWPWRIGAVRLVEAAGDRRDAAPVSALDQPRAAAACCRASSEIGVDATTLLACVWPLRRSPGLLFGLAPALHLSRTNYARPRSPPADRDPSGAHPGALRLRSLLVAVAGQPRDDAAGRRGTPGPQLRQAAERGPRPRPGQRLTFQLVFPPPPPAGERQLAIIER